MSHEANAHRWVLKDRDGHEIRSTETFESRAAAEQWLGQRWPSLLDEGAVSVVLLDAAAVVYEMSLRTDSDE
jgi:hypothetical protein